VVVFWTLNADPFILFQANTVAQGTIDMNLCNDVVYAESVTDQKHSLGIFTSKERFFVRGENKEDIMGYELLPIGLFINIYVVFFIN